MIDLHATFAEWVAAGAESEPPRDIVLHASGCPRCLAVAAGYDALRAIDVGMAPEPPIVAARDGASVALRAGRAFAGIASVALIGAAIVIGTGVLRFGQGTNLAAIATPTPTAFAQGVLGGTPPTPTATPSSADETADPSATASAATSAEPQPVPTTAPVLTPVTTPRATPTGTPVAPSPTATTAPTAAATAVPTPAATATPILPSRIPTPTPVPTAPPPSEAAP
ncbi:MAG TPA: hypothetical protein VHR55_03805 [Candidatus Limnocylindria bacterium]|nr:hypothetical protein [Candidatus Limnocylindria bacterium]